ncbi:hypothetical protein DITRI_Ditri07aG0001500 [Diplodiscus trichospermus]
MSQRREISQDGKELLFDHGAPYFTVTNPDVLSVVAEWESRGLVAEWKLNFWSFDCFSNEFFNTENQERQSKKYVGVPGMNSICRALCLEPGVESKFNVGIGNFDWIELENLWSLTGSDGQNLGQFKGVVASDKNIISPRFTEITGRSPPLALSLAPEWVELHNIPVNPCFALMLAFTDPLSSVPAKAFSFTNSKVLSWAYCENSKPGRSCTSERWVLHSTMEYAKDVIAQTGLQKPSKETLSKVGNEMLQEFLGTGLSIAQPFFKKAHRWGSAFPAASIAEEEKCLWDEKKRLAICGDFCVSPNVEGAILSGLAAASKLKGMLSNL